jgi:hypothetical protein
MTTVDPPRFEQADDLELDGFSRGNDVSELGASTSAFYDEDASLELDAPGGDPRALRLSSKPPQQQSVRGPSLAPRPSGGPRSGSPRDDERMARELASYGEPDEGLGAPGYVLRVVARMASLYRERRQIEQRSRAHADAYEQALRDLGRALLDDSAVMQHEALRERVLNVQTRQGELAAAEAKTRAAEAQAESELAALQKKSAALEAELLPFRQAESRAESKLAALSAELKRKKAKLQRAEIELRALTRASVPPPAERLQGIEVERSQQQRELDGLAAAQAEATAALTRARRELSLRRGAVDGVSSQHLKHESAVRMSSHAHEEAVARAEHALSAALCTLAEAADAVGLAHAAAEQVAGLRSSERTLDEVVDQLARYDRALTVYHRPTLLRGALMWATLLVVLGILARVW